MPNQKQLRKLVTIPAIYHKKARLEAAKQENDTIQNVVERALEAYFTK